MSLSGPTSITGPVMTYSRHSFPVNYGGWGGMSVPQRVIDCFLMKDGKKPAESPLYEARPNQAYHSEEVYRRL